MISVVMPYFNRRGLLLKTLAGFEGHSEFEVIIVDDASSQKVDDVPPLFSFPIKVVRIEPKAKKHVNPCVPFNIGIRESSGDKIILQNPECTHVGGILEYVDETLIDGDYISFACYSLGPMETSRALAPNFDINTLVKSLRNQSCDVVGGINSWYNHSVLRPKAYHFISAITRKDLYDLNGFDERYANGSGWDDDDLIRRIRLKGMNVRIVDDPYSVHLFHSRNSTHFAQLNRPLFRKIVATENTHRAKLGIK